MKKNIMIKKVTILSLFAFSQVVAQGEIVRYHRATDAVILDARSIQICKCSSLDIVCERDAKGMTHSPYRLFCDVNDAKGGLVRQEWVIVDKKEDLNHQLAADEPYRSADAITTNRVALIDDIVGDGVVMHGEWGGGMGPGFLFIRSAGGDGTKRVYCRRTDEDFFRILPLDGIKIFGRLLPFEVWCPNGADKDRKMELDGRFSSDLITRCLAIYESRRGNVKDILRLGIMRFRSDMIDGIKDDWQKQLQIASKASREMISSFDGCFDLGITDSRQDLHDKLGQRVCHGFFKVKDDPSAYYSFITTYFEEGNGLALDIGLCRQFPIAIIPDGNSRR